MGGVVWFGKQFSISSTVQYQLGLGTCSLVFIRMARFLRAKEQFVFLEERINFFTLLVKSYRRENHSGCFFKNSDVSNSVKEREERWRVIHFFVLGLKRGKAWWKERNWSKSLKQSESLFHKEQIATLYLLKGKILSCCSLQKEQQERISLVALYLKSDKSYLLLSFFL